MWIIQKCWLQPSPPANREVIHLLLLPFFNQKYTWNWPKSAWLSNIFMGRNFYWFYINWFWSIPILQELLYFFTLNGLLHLPILRNTVPLWRWHAAHHVLAHCVLQSVDRYSVKHNWVTLYRLKHLSHLLGFMPLAFLLSVLPCITRKADRLLEGNLDLAFRCFSPSLNLLLLSVVECQLLPF